ncbi:MAG: MarR family transcriptional regulator [Candidatus Zixiibacteriota bacterium]|nr:MAG: MarR family transcriptional regulator [candidate division Zixibacteria bacterium]
MNSMERLEEKARQLTDLIFELTHQIQSQHPSAHIQDCDVSFAELGVILYLSRKGPSIMREMADYAGSAVSTMTGVVDRLVAKGLVTRQRPEEDRRIVQVELTDKARAVLRAHFHEHMAVSRAILAALNEEDQEALITVMQKVVKKQSQPAEPA